MSQSQSTNTRPKKPRRRRTLKATSQTLTSPSSQPSNPTQPNQSLQTTLSTPINHKLTLEPATSGKTIKSNWKTIRASLKTVSRNRAKKRDSQEPEAQTVNPPPGKQRKIEAKKRHKQAKKTKKVVAMNAQRSTSQGAIQTPGGVPQVSQVEPQVNSSKSPAPLALDPKEFEGNVDFIRFDGSDHDEELVGDLRQPMNANSHKPQGMKRKFGAGPGVTEAEANEVRKKKGSTITPWFDSLQWKNRTVQQMLTAEIGSFVAYIKPTREEDELRLMVIDMIRRVVQTQWPDADVVPFGSFGTKLYLPGGDIDLVLLSTRMMKDTKSKILYRLAPLIREQNIGQEVVVIAKAKVPIIKFKTIFGNFQVDISINQANGLVALKKVNELLDDIKYLSLDLQADQRSSQKSRKGKETDQGDSDIDQHEEAINKVVEDLGAAKCMILVIKSVLKQRGMNEVYSGGLGSYSIICLVTSFLQLHPKIQRGDIDPNKNLGVLLLEFFELYGKHYNFDETGISVRHGGHYFSKIKRGWQRERQPYLLSIEDPADESNDIAGGSHNIMGVRSVFSGAFDLLCATLYHRHSLQMSRADAISSRRLQTSRPLLAVPKPNQAQDTEEELLVDPMKQSLLGEVMGVTKELVENRKKNLKLFYSGTLQRMLKMSPPPSPTQCSPTTTNIGDQASSKGADGKSKRKPKKNRKKDQEKAADRSEVQASSKISNSLPSKPCDRSVQAESYPEDPRQRNGRQRMQYGDMDDTRPGNSNSQRPSGREKGRIDSSRDETSEIPFAWVEDTQPCVIHLSHNPPARLSDQTPPERTGRHVQLGLDLSDSLVTNLVIPQPEVEDEDSRYNIIKPPKAKRVKYDDDLMSREPQSSTTRSKASLSSPRLTSTNPLTEKSYYALDGSDDTSGTDDGNLEEYLRGTGPSRITLPIASSRPSSDRRPKVMGPRTPPSESKVMVDLTSSHKLPIQTSLTANDQDQQEQQVDPHLSPGTPAGTPPASASKLSQEARQQLWLSKGQISTD